MKKLKNNAFTAITLTMLLVICLLLSSCKLIITGFILPHSAGTGEIFTLTLNIEATDQEDGAEEEGIVLQLPEGWEVLSASIYSDTFSVPLTEQIGYESLYTSEQGYKIWVGTFSQHFPPDEDSDISVVIKVLTGDFSGSPGSTNAYSIKASTGAFRNDNWVADDPEGVFDFSSIDDVTHHGIISITKQEADTQAPAAVDVNLNSSSSCAPEALLNWENYDEDAQKDVIKYYIYQTNTFSSTTDGMRLIATVPLGSIFFTVENLSPGEGYYFAVTAVDEQLNENKTVEPVQFTAPYGADLTVRIMDIRNNEPLPDIDTALRNDESSSSHFMNSRTDTEGIAGFPSLCSGVYHVEAGGETQTVDIDALQQTSYEIQLHLLPVIVLTETAPDAHIASGFPTRVYGTAINNTITVESGGKVELINFPGNNTVTIRSNVENFFISRAGATVTIEGYDGTDLKLPATSTPQTINFNNASGTLLIDSGQVMLGEQIVDTASAPIELKN